MAKNEKIENVSYETSEELTKEESSSLDFKETPAYKDFIKELKEIKETLKSFEISEDEQEAIIKSEIEKDEEPTKKGGFVIVALLAIVALCVIFWDKIRAKFEKKTANSAM